MIRRNDLYDHSISLAVPEEVISCTSLDLKINSVISMGLGLKVLLLHSLLFLNVLIDTAGETKHHACSA